MRAYDIDGVLAAGIKPKKPYVVISGRLIEEWERTIKEIGLDAPIYLRPYGKYGDHTLAGLWKATMINNLRITEIYEDIEFQADIIRALCPACKVNIVK